MLINNRSNINISTLANYYNQNIVYLQSIYLKGAPSYLITSNDSTINSVLSSDFILTFIQYAGMVSDKLSNVTTTDELAILLFNMDKYIYNYLHSFSSYVAD